MKNDWMNDARKIPGDAMGYIRKLAVRAVIEGGYSPELVIDIFGLSRSVIYDWINKFKNGGYDALDTNYPPGMDPIITETMDEWLRDVVLSKNPTDYGYDTVLWTCDILAELLERVFKIKVTGATVNAHIKKMGLSYQKPNYRASEQNADEIEHFLNDKFPKIQQLAEKINAEIAFEDESGIELNAHSGYTWGDKGKTPEIIATGQRGKCNVLSIVTKDGKMQYLITQDNVNSEIYIEFLEQLLEGRTQPLILLVDRVSFHKSKKVRDFVRYNREKFVSSFCQNMLLNIILRNSYGRT